ncbi:MAG: hypothetical protein HY824_05125 [Acidobacteria bacterium]|nr:hypothetical protein [Acidobacteriota bacterium]
MTLDLRGAARAIVPLALRRRLRDLASDRTSASLGRALAGLARSRGPIILGPWLGEVGFELLYWVPFLQWAVAEAPLDRARLVVVSRGGPQSWYRRVADRYADVFDVMTPEEFHARNQVRHAEIGEQKQTQLTALDTDIVARTAARLGLEQYSVLHPSRMHAVFNPYWWGHRSVEWVERHARFEPFEPVDVPAGERPPDGYAAVKFYFNDAFPASAGNRALAARVVRELGDEGPVISLATGLRVDDHADWEEEERMSARGIRSVTPSTNLATQTALIAGARLWAGTYGGFSYLAPFLRVPARAFYSNPAGFSRRHLDLAQRTFDRFGPNLLQLADVRDTAAGALRLSRAVGR